MHSIYWDYDAFFATDSSAVYKYSINIAYECKSLIPVKSILRMWIKKRPWMCQRKKTQQILTLSFYDLCLIVERDNKKKAAEIRNAELLAVLFSFISQYFHWPFLSIDDVNTKTFTRVLLLNVISIATYILFVVIQIALGLTASI